MSTSSKSQQTRRSPDPDGPVCAGSDTGPSEEESHREHRAALEATLFHDPASPDEVVLELDSGLLRLLTPRS